MMNIREYGLLFQIFSLAFGLELESSEGAEIEILARGFETTNGKFSVALFPEVAAKQFPKNGVLKSSSVPIQSDKTSKLVWRNIPKGRYGVAAYHDENGNGALDMNWLGIPIEPMSFSNGAKARFGPPSFEEVAFTVAPEGAKLELKLNYLFK